MTKHGPHELLAGTPKTALRVYAIRLPDGDCPALDWLTSLNPQQSAAIGSRLRIFSEVGWLKSPDAYNNLDEADPRSGVPRVDEIKHVGQDLRLYVVDFSPGDSTAYVTHGTKKPKKRQVAKQVARARAIYQEGNVR